MSVFIEHKIVSKQQTVGNINTHKSHKAHLRPVGVGEGVLCALLDRVAGVVHVVERTEHTRT